MEGELLSLDEPQTEESGASMPRIECVDIGEVLKTTRRPLVSNQVGASDIEHRLRSEVSRRTIGPRLLESDPIDGREQINAVGWHAELDDSAWSEVGRRQAEIAEPEIRQCLQHALDVVGGWIDEYVDVLRETRLRMVRDRITANDESPSAPGRQAREQIFEVLRHVAQSSPATASAATRPLRLVHQGSDEPRIRDRPRALRRRTRTCGAICPRRDYTPSASAVAIRRLRRGPVRARCRAQPISCDARARAAEGLVRGTDLPLPEDRLDPHGFLRVHDDYGSIEGQLALGKATSESLLKGADGAVLRELHAWLKKKDPGFGGLVRVMNKRQEFLWVHPRFEREY